MADLEKRYIASCPTSVIMKLAGRWDKHIALYTITKHGTVFFKCLLCKTWGYINNAEMAHDFIEELQKNAEPVAPTRGREQSPRASSVEDATTS